MSSGRLRLTVLLAAVALGCGSSSAAGSGADTAKQAATDAATRLEGSWTLVEFQTDQALEPMLATLLASQMNQLTATFHAGTLQIEGVGVNATRSYRVTQAAADGFSLTITDPMNVEYRSTGAFQANDLFFTSLTDPWRGHGRLRRSR
ncbi:MAG TPA: hypothetical protein VGQ57_13120 [Polyangiaceae bacterium]|jgi:hypothetical protein|nr:hypothetical protein [Polyangiaceae bacterium]